MAYSLVSVGHTLIQLTGHLRISLLGMCLTIYVAKLLELQYHLSICAHGGVHVCLALNKVSSSL